MTPAESYRPQLIVYAVWHPDHARGAELASALFSHLARDARTPTARGLGIPVFFRTAPATAGSAVPLAIDLTTAQHSVVVVLIDTKMLLAAGWDEYAAAIWRQCADIAGPHRLIPVSFLDEAYDLHPDMAAANFIRLHQVEPEMQTERLLNTVTHELCRLLLNRPAAAAVDAAPAATEIAPAPVQLFISHAKKDGLELAQTLRDYVGQKLSLKTFFDANDIAPGAIFYKEIDGHVERSALLIVLTDAYASREWCQHEVVWAKRHGRPVLVVHAIQDEELRSFPYAGNVPVIRWGAAQEGNRCEHVIGRLLREVLRYCYFKRHFEDLRQLYCWPADVQAIPHPPELLTCLLARSRAPAASLYVYPDPPLGVEELKLLREFDPEFRLITPTLLPTVTFAK